ncbi:MAG: preprotein translocase subunit SecE [Pseudohongiellaceae bacterium]|jgi:preprotein translocase subunit SecE
MSDKAISAGSNLDTLKWVIVAVLVVAGVYGNSYFANESLLLRVIGLLVLAGIAGFIAAQTTKGRAFIKLGAEARTEIRKVVWPTRQETMHTTLIVAVVVVIMSFVLWGLDSTISWIISLLIG